MNVRVRSLCGCGTCTSPFIIMPGIIFKKETDEERWIRKSLHGNKAAAEWIYHRHVRYLSALCSRYLTSDDDIKDVLQESFLKIFSSLKNFNYRGEGSLRAWMAKITLTETLKFIRSNSRFEFVDIETGGKDWACEDGIVTEDIPTETLHRFIRELPDGYRTVFNLYVIDDMSHKQIAALLGIKENSSASQLHKAKALLAKRIKQYRTVNSI